MGVFKTVIVCEDIREEIGNKKSLMGVFPGDIVVPRFPAPVQFMIYLEYVPDDTDSSSMSFDTRLLVNDAELGKGSGGTSLIANQVVVFMLPKGVMTFDKESTLRLLVSVNSGPEKEIVSKRILLSEAISSPNVIAQP